MRKTTRIVWAVFTDSPRQRLAIPTTSQIWSAVCDLIDPEDKPQLVGVLDQTQTKWID